MNIAEVTLHPRTRRPRYLPLAQWTMKITIQGACGFPEEHVGEALSYLRGFEEAATRMYVSHFLQKDN